MVEGEAAVAATPEKATVGERPISPFKPMSTTGTRSTTSPHHRTAPGVAPGSENSESQSSNGSIGAATGGGGGGAGSGAGATSGGGDAVLANTVVPTAVLTARAAASSGISAAAGSNGRSVSTPLLPGFGGSTVALPATGVDEGEGDDGSESGAMDMA